MPIDFLSYRLGDISKKIITNTIFQLLGKTVSMTITMFITLVIAHLYGRDQFGQFNLMQTWPALVFIIVDFGFNAIAVKEITKDPSKTEELLGNILTLRILMSILIGLFLAGVLVLFPYSNHLKWGIILNLSLILTQSLYASTNIIFQSKLRYDLSVIGYLMGYVFILFSVIFLALNKVSVVWISFTYVLGGLVTFFTNIIFINRIGVKIRLVLNKVLIKRLFVATLPLGLMFVFSQINFKSDSILLSILELPKWLKFSNNESVAIYGLPYKVFEVGLVVPTFFMNAAYPVFVSHLKESGSKFLNTFKKSIIFSGVSALLISIIGVLASPFMIKLLGGEQFESSILISQILLSGLILYFLTQPFAWLLVTFDNQKVLPWIYLIGAIFNVTANYLFIPIYSFYASAVITHLSELLILSMLIYFSIRTVRNRNV